MNALKKKKLNIKSILFVFFMAVVCLFACVAMFQMSITPAVALEQQLRCNISEHTHTDDCYSDEFLTCEKTAHTHDGNCYIVLLKENDINGILSLISNGENPSLEYMITDVMGTALTFNSNLTTQEDLDVMPNLSQQTVATLNTTISEEDTIPDIVLNENINNLQALAAGNQNATQSGASTYAVGDDPVTDQTIGNVYVYLDNAWTFIGTTDITVSGSGNSRSVNVATSKLLETVNGALGTNFTYQSFDISASRYESRSFTKYTLGQTQTTIATGQSSTNAARARYIRLIPKNSYSATNTAFNFYSAKFVYPEGTVETKYVRSGTEVTMPSGNYKWTNGNNTYAAGESVTITSAKTFTGERIGPITSISINYNVNFPTISDATVSTMPTVAGTTAQTATETYSQHSSAVIKNVSQHTVKGKVKNNSTGLSRVAQFKGWKVGSSSEILQPNTTLVWEELLQYADGAVLNLTAVWETDPLITATFFVRFDSVAVDTEGNIGGQDQTKYTDELFATYVGGVDTDLPISTLDDNNIADTTSDNSFGADQAIRALYGEKSQGVWLYEFPHDDFVFEELKQYAETGYLSVEGVKVAAEDLNDREYAIRWYVFKVQDDAWHIDGKLVRKEGLIHVYKTFAGNKELIKEAKSDFYIDATDITAQTNTVLNLSNYTTYNEATDTYMWEITNVDYGEEWRITEHPHLFNNPDIDFSVFSEYTVMDAIGDQSISSSGTSLSVTGMTYALDEGTDEVLRAEFTNIYNKSDSIIIKKQDSLTGVSIGGATFQLLQNGKPLKFNYNTASEVYEFDAVNGTETILSGNANGYFEIAIHDFSYDVGPITVREITAPTGYTPIGDIEIGYTDDQNTVGILSGNSELIKFMSGILIVGNSTESSSVTAKKAWDCPESEWQDVRVQLYANGKLVTTVIAGVEPQVTLNAANGWQHTWHNLPVYVNGEKIEWSIKEVMIGTESPKADGTFVNWIASYELPIKSTDENGNEHTTLTVTNTTKRVMLRLTKTNLSKTLQLAGAGFMLEAVDSSGNVLTNEISKSSTTGEAGTLIFDNLKAGIRYRLTETAAPEGYHLLNEYVYFTINEDGSVSVEDSFYASAGTTAYNIVVFNAAAIDIPESGGFGTGMFYAAGLLLILIALGVYIDTIRKRRCQN